MQPGRYVWPNGLYITIVKEIISTTVITLHVVGRVAATVASTCAYCTFCLYIYTDTGRGSGARAHSLSYVLFFVSVARSNRLHLLLVKGQDAFRIFKSPRTDNEKI